MSSEGVVSVEEKVVEEKSECDVEKEDAAEEESQVIRVAVVGCSHGELDTIYDTLRRRETDLQTKIDVLLCCGDFQVSICTRS